MNDEQGRAAVLALLGEIAPEADLADLDLDRDVRSELDLDSMDFLNLVEGLAESTGVDVPESDYAKVRSVHGLVNYLVARSAGTAPSPATDR
jgi:acyl carrier protein